MTEDEAKRREEKLSRVVDDVLVGRDLHGLSPRVARDLQLAAAAVNHDRFRKLLGELARLLAEGDDATTTCGR